MGTERSILGYRTTYLCQRPLPSPLAPSYLLVRIPYARLGVFFEETN